MKTLQGVKMKALKLMADYQCFPLWQASTNAVGNVDPQSLPISLALQNRLLSWAEKFDATLNADDPARSGFLNESAASEFRAEGEMLVRCLQDELGSVYAIVKKL
ncbi:hypothetical protein WJ970_02615 [Achromobacter xylosoxidans]